ncbi:MAG: methyl-accepting chemotaxis protein [Fibromonadaceae bacterium]|jgi:iron only hydrogenase large subunit-like protein|nr:methyl-accepting chemotaxis protein [Fibromonadaceae bacterium]
MRSVIVNHLDLCVGCNRCIRVCPIEEANVAWAEPNGKVKVRVDNAKCIVCGLCLTACHHDSRHYQDDTEKFFNDLRIGTQISVFAAPAIRTNFHDYGQLLSLLRSMGVKKIYDVSLGADICTWAHIRYIQKNGPKPIISQPCPAIVNYILTHKNELLKHLSPIHSPMLCTAIFMQKYEKVGTKIAALSPCVAKNHEFDATGFVDYNVTFKKIQEYLKRNRISMPMNSSGFDHYEAGLGSLYPMPGGLKECVEHYIGKSLRIDKSEGVGIVYKALDEYAKQPVSKLPAVFDVLNCLEGCNVGTGCGEHADIFEVNSKMDALRQAAIKEDNVAYMDELFKKFDETLRLEDFIRHYTPAPVQAIHVTQQDIDAAWVSLSKFSQAQKVFDCGACGCDTCLEMATKIAKGVNVPKSCPEKVQSDVDKEHAEAKVILDNFLKSSEIVVNETSDIGCMIKGINEKMGEVTDAISSYNQMITDIERISEKVNIISLNASVEAAKAGRYGLAFDVVAKEIRNLAQSSADSAARTKMASQKANSAMETVNKSVRQINEKVHSSNEIIIEISNNTKKLLHEQGG